MQWSSVDAISQNLSKKYLKNQQVVLEINLIVKTQAPNISVIAYKHIIHHNDFSHRMMPFHEHVSRKSNKRMPISASITNATLSWNPFKFFGE